MEYVLPYLTLKQRKNVALTCKSLAQAHREFPFAELRICNATLPFLSRAECVRGSCSESLTLPSCTSLAITLLADAKLVLPRCTKLSLMSRSKIDLYAPNLETVGFSGSRQTFLGLGLRNLVDLLILFDEYERVLPVRIDSCTTLNCFQLQNVFVDHCENLTTSPEEPFDSFSGTSLCLQNGCIRKPIPFRGHLKIENCSFETLKLPDSLKSLRIHNCNMIVNDLESFPVCEHIDVSDNHTLQTLPETRCPLKTLNLLHTGIYRQSAVSLSLLSETADFVGINVRFEDMNDFEQLLQTKKIKRIVVCPNPYVEDLVTSLLDQYSFESRTVHTWAHFSKNPCRCSFFSFGY